MSLHTKTVPVVRESASRRAAPRADTALRNGRSAALATWLSSHDFPDIHSRGIDGITPLMLASLHGEDRVVATLLDEGARIAALDDEGNHALWYACLGGAPAPILRLVEAGIEIDHANDNDITCLMQAAASGRVEVMQLLLSLGASEGPSAPDGRNAFDMAADRGFELLRTVRRLGNAKQGSPGADSHCADAGRPAIEADVFADKAA
ncbi:ankyrin repeat domain-containing protein [Paraburkholderia lycopersici]|uniref:Ankyrin repeat-containing protein n=1 Tax=Paraburkholderia lycopersici TaxID=416944 RepID=A0A1G6P5S6_9BURK|nr:ankyrin repeat domain-containing protein [Paraburkholderia lycopersici]SDC75552.1 Ankyrin repeat-containing protein [Paraburkholderia lycopersici]